MPAIRRVDPAAPARLPRAFFADDAERVARGLLGKVFVHRAADSEEIRARVVETEAYVGPHDLASHASKGRTARTEVMFGPPGHAYVYLIYGMHQMLNVVTGPEGIAQAVLLRAADPLEGTDASMSGPGRLARAMGITRAHNGVDVCGETLFFLEGPAPDRICTSPRIGVDYAGEWRDRELRFFDPASRSVSRAPRRR